MCSVRGQVRVRSEGAVRLKSGGYVFGVIGQVSVRCTCY